MRQEVDEGVVLARVVGGYPIHLVPHTLLLEQLHRMLGESLVKGRQTAWQDRVRPQLIDPGFFLLADRYASDEPYQADCDHGRGANDTLPRLHCGRLLLADLVHCVPSDPACVGETAGPAGSAGERCGEQPRASA